MPTFTLGRAAKANIFVSKPEKVISIFKQTLVDVLQSLSNVV